MEPENTALDESQAATALDSLFADPQDGKENTESEVAINAAGKPYDPKTGKLLPTKKDEEKDEDEDTPAKEEKEEDAPPPRMVKVKVDGMEVDVDEEELKKGYSRTSDYTKKTQALAEERKRFEAEERAAVRAERQTYAENLTRVQAALEALAPPQEPDWMTLQDQMTPEEFTKHFTSWKANRARLERVEAEQERVRSLQEQDTQRARVARLEQEKAALEAAIPDLKDAEKGKTLRHDLSEYAKSVGFTDDELALVEDHRPLVLLHKARLWDESQKNRPKVEEKVDRALESLRPTGTKPAPKQKEVDGLKSRLSASGSQEDAAALIDKLMGVK
jgi:hypothetical protein